MPIPTTNINAQCPLSLPLYTTEGALAAVGMESVEYMFSEGDGVIVVCAVLEDGDLGSISEIPFSVEDDTASGNSETHSIIQVSQFLNIFMVVCVVHLSLITATIPHSLFKPCCISFLLLRFYESTFAFSFLFSPRPSVTHNVITMPLILLLRFYKSTLSFSFLFSPCPSVTHNVITMPLILLLRLYKSTLSILLSVHPLYPSATFLFFPSLPSLLTPHHFSLSLLLNGYLCCS